MISGVFIDRPRLAIVIAVLLTLAGALSMQRIAGLAVPRHRAAAGHCRHAPIAGASAAVVEADRRAAARSRRSSASTR